MNAAQQITRAVELGVTAANSQRELAPYKNGDLMALIVGRPVGVTPEGEASTLEILRAYTSAWNTANDSLIIHAKAS